MTGKPLNRPLQNIGDDLHPDPARRSAVGNDEALGSVADLVHHLDMMRDRVGVGLEQRPPQMADVVREREPIECRARAGVVDRRFFAEKIGRDDQPVAAGGSRVGEPVEPLMDREASLLAASASPDANLRANQFSAEPPVDMQPLGTKSPGLRW